MILYLPSLARTLSNIGQLASGAKLYFYYSETEDLAPVYTDTTGDTLADNPAEANGVGLFDPVYLNAAIGYRAVLKSSDDSVTFYDAELGDPPQVYDVSTVAEFDEALALVGADGGRINMAPGTYHFTTQRILTSTGWHNILITGYGAKITTSGAIAGLKIADSNYIPSQIVIEGLTISHLNNTTATAGFELAKASLVTLNHCVVESYGNQASYQAYWLHNKTANDDNTGCFWCTLNNCSVRSQSGGTTPCGVRLQGAANATRIIGGSYGGVVTTCIQLTYENGQSTIPNGVVIDGVSFETFTTAIHVLGETTHPVGGLRVVNNRAEDGTTFVSLTGTTTTTAFGSSPSEIHSNYVIPSMTYLNNPNNLPITPRMVAQGVATFAAGTTVAVTLPYAEPDTSYRITLTPLADPVGRLWAASKATSGFTITNSSSTSISVDWTVSR